MKNEEKLVKSSSFIKTKPFTGLYYYSAGTTEPTFLSNFIQTLPFPGPFRIKRKKKNKGTSTYSSTRKKDFFLSRRKIFNFFSVLHSLLQAQAQHTHLWPTVLYTFSGTDTTLPKGQPKNALRAHASLTHHAPTAQK